MKGMWLVMMMLLASVPSVAQSPAKSNLKTAGAFYTPRMRAKATANAEKYAWAAEIRKQIVDAAQPWMRFSNDQLWDLMFGPTITRSWMVWSNGFCPACKEGVPMYTWEIDALAHPWKVSCPHCKQCFPKNDFHKFYLSGLDEHGVFDPARADRSLLFNVEHPDPADPLHAFGVDDGDGYVEGDRRWRFIGAYLIYGQWKQAIVGGISKLAAAYAVTGDPAYAHKAGVMLDRVADLYPTFDFGKQGKVYEDPGLRGYVSTWHDACAETRELVMAYDEVFDAIRGDDGLVVFLSGKARTCRLDNPKASFADIQRNIEDRILRDAIANREKIESNFPQTDITLILAHTVLGWPDNRDQVRAMLEPIIDRSTAVDGLTGEKGLAAYSCFSPQTVAVILEQYARIDPGFFTHELQRRPQIYDSYRFYIDTWALGKYYPNIGDSGGVGQPCRIYKGVGFTRSPGISSSAYAFMWRLYQTTGDPAFAQVLYSANDSKLDGLPHDLYADDPESFQSAVAEVVRRHGASPRIESVNKEQWHLALLKSGEGDDARVLWLDYDAGGNHGHADCMNIGFYANGLDLMPDFGYPPVQYGGWQSPRAKWYTTTAAHNTVTVDGKNQERTVGCATLWADGDSFRAVRASGAQLIAGKQYERTVALVDVSARDCYALDVFRVVGGTDHARFLRSSFGALQTWGLDLAKEEPFAGIEQMRAFRTDASPCSGWTADWTIEDRANILPAGAQVHLRCTDLTADAEASTGEAWISPGFTSYNDAWIPQLMVRRRSDKAPLSSTFVQVLEPYEGKPPTASARRLELHTLGGQPYPDSHVAVELRLADGRSDLFVSADMENPLVRTPVYDAHNALVNDDWNLRLVGQMCFVRRDALGRIERIALCKGTSVRVGSVSLDMKHETDYIEIAFNPSGPQTVSGDPAGVKNITVD